VNIADVIPQDNYSLFIRTDDGRCGVFDVTPFLDAEAFAPLKDKREFSHILNRKCFVEWQCGADLSSDTILTLWKPAA